MAQLALVRDRQAAEQITRRRCRTPGGTVRYLADLDDPRARPAHRLDCPSCGWWNYRRNRPGADPWWLPCPRCGVSGDKLIARLAGCTPRKRRRCAYLIHIYDGHKHAWSYLGFTTNLPVRWAQHLAGGYNPETHKATAHAARLLAAAIAAGCRIELVRVWYGTQARALEQQLKQKRKVGSLRCGAARSLRPLCPLCNPAGWWRRYPDLPDPKREPGWHRFRPDPAFANPDADWDAAGFDRTPTQARPLADATWLALPAHRAAR